MLGLFLKSIVGWYWVGLVWRSGCKKRNVWFSKEMLSKVCENPCFCCGYIFSYNHPNGVIQIGK